MLKTKILAAAFGAMTLMPLSAGAVTLEIDDLSTGGVDFTASSPVVASYAGSVGAFNITASSAITHAAQSHTLNTTSINITGIGAIRFTATETGLSNFGAASLLLSGFGSISDAAYSISVAHYFNTGSGWTLIQNVMNFLPPTNNQSASVGGTMSPSGLFDLRTVIDVVTKRGDQVANVNGTIMVSAVPVPAAGLMLAGAVAGLGALRRRKAKVA